MTVCRCGVVLSLVWSHDAEYHLLVYGSLTFDENYVRECEILIRDLGIEGNVELRGLGNPTDVLARGWCYLQVTNPPPTTTAITHVVHGHAFACLHIVSGISTHIEEHPSFANANVLAMS